MSWGPNVLKRGRSSFILRDCEPPCDGCFCALNAEAGWLAQSCQNVARSDKRARQSCSGYADGILRMTSLAEELRRLEGDVTTHDARLLDDGSHSRRETLSAASDQDDEDDDDDGEQERMVFDNKTLDNPMSLEIFSVWTPQRQTGIPMKNTVHEDSFDSVMTPIKVGKCCTSPSTPNRPSSSQPKAPPPSQTVSEFDGDGCANFTTQQLDHMLVSLDNRDSLSLSLAGDTYS